MADSVIIRIPATTRHIGLVRAAASALAARLNFTYDRIMDLRIAVDEACVRLLAASDPPARRLEVVFEVEAGALLVAARVDARPKQGTTFLNPWSERILESVTDWVKIDTHDERARVVLQVGRGDWR